MTNTIMDKTPYKSIVTVHCKDGTKRVVKVLGLYNPNMASMLGRDLEDSNFKYATVTF